MPLLIHLGVRASEVDVLRNQIVRLIPEGVDIKRDDESWWSTYTETMLDDPIHLTIETMTPMVIMQFLASRFDNFLVPLSGQEFDGVKIYVTDISKRSFETELEEYVELRWPE